MNKNQWLQLTFMGCLLLMNSCGGTGEDGGDKDSTNKRVKTPQEILSEIDINSVADVYKLDSIPIVRNMDTAKMNEESKDSLLFSIKFQEAANRLSKAEREKNYAVLVSYVPPEVIKFYGSKEKLVDRIKSIDQQKKVPNYEKVLSGPVQRIAPSKDNDGYAQNWYCLMPVRSYYTDASGKKSVDVRWLGGEIDVFGKNIYFLDITDKSREKILQVMPGLTIVLDK